MLTGRSNLLLVCALAGALSGLLASYIETILWDVTVLSFGPTIASFYAGGIFGCLIAMAISLAYRPNLNSLSVMLFVGLIGGGVGKVAGGVVLDIILATLATSSQAKTNVYFFLVADGIWMSTLVGAILLSRGWLDGHGPWPLPRLILAAIAGSLAGAIEFSVPLNTTPMFMTMGIPINPHNLWGAIEGGLVGACVALGRPRTGHLPRY